MFYYLTCNRYRRSPSLACACAGCERGEGRCRADSSSTGALCGELPQSVRDSSSLSCLEDPLRSKHDDTLQPLRNNSMIRSKYQKSHINRLLCALSLVDDCSHPSSCPRFFQVCVRPLCVRQTFLSTAGECRLHVMQTDKFICPDREGHTCLYFRVLSCLVQKFRLRVLQEHMKKLGCLARAFYRLVWKCHYE